MKNLGIAVGIAAVLWFIPPPSGVTTQAWHLLAVFIGTIVGIITKPLPLGAVAILGLGASMLTKTLTFSQAFSAFASEIPCVPRVFIRMHTSVLTGIVAASHRTAAGTRAEAVPLSDADG